MRQVRHQVARTSSRLVSIGPKQLEGFLTVPEHATGLIIFAHGSGSSRLSPRNAFVAEALQLRGMATLLLIFSPTRRLLTGAMFSTCRCLHPDWRRP